MSILAVLSIVACIPPRTPDVTLFYYLRTSPFTPSRGHQKGIDPKYKDFIKEHLDFSGIPYEVTPNGINLINADTIKN